MLDLDLKLVDPKNEAAEKVYCMDSVTPQYSTVQLLSETAPQRI